MRKNMALSLCIAIATLAFNILNGGTDAPIVVHGLTLAGFIAALVTMPLEKKNVE
jgi:hypothetical protein